MDYKDTLLMPKTSFPMRGNLANREPEMRTKWNDMNLYELRLEKNKDNTPFVLHDGPPYANGNIHMGHALNKILKDFVVRYKSMQGFYSPYIPGWDTHGLPIETALTKKGVKRKEMSVAEFRKLCAEYAYEQVDNQRGQFKELSILGDWDNPYITLQPEYEARQIEVFAKMAERGLIYKGLKPVYWSPTSESALAEAEIEYKDKTSASIFVAFPVVETNGLALDGAELIIWTTTPWTLPANLAVAVHEKFEYALVKVNDRKFVVAKDMLEDLATNVFEWTEYETVETFTGLQLEGVKYKHVLYDRLSPVILGEHVTLESGSGLVHTAPGHGEDDFVIGKKYGLDILCPVNNQGVLTEEAGEFAGMYYDKANKAITDRLDELGALLKLDFIKHSYPHDWRTKKPIIFRATAQWFASIDNIREDILTEINNIKWYPAWGENRLYNMIRDRGDWCISRQRAWGVPIPIFYAENGEEIVDFDVIMNVANLFRTHGSNIWFEWDAKDLLPEGYTHPGSPNGTFTKEKDIMDVWFDSGSSHTSAGIDRGMAYPSDLYLEGSDQYRGWFNSSLITGVAVHNQTPYKNLVSHGFVVDEKGFKMSKSVGNVIDPLKLMKKYGSDIIRLWVASVDYQQDVRIGNELMKQVAESYRKIRNTFRFLLGNISDFEQSNAVKYEDLQDVDKYILIKLDKYLENVIASYDNYDFQSVFKLTTNFMTTELSNFYMDFTKDVLYVDKQDGIRRRSIQTVFNEVVNVLVKVLVPILPYTTDEVYSNLNNTNEKSVYLENMPKVKGLSDDAIIEKFDKFLQVRSDVLKALEVARNDKLIGKSLEAILSISLKDEYKDIVSIDELKLLFMVSKVEVVESTSFTEYDTAYINVDKFNGHKCERCWTYYDEVEMVSETLCHRCNDVLN